jgi:aminopeptidase-like protein
MQHSSLLLSGARVLETILEAAEQPLMMPLLRQLWPICRSIAGPGVRESLDILAEILPLERYATPSGETVYDWQVPPEWRIHEAYIADQSGARVVDFRNNNLHVVQYSEPVDAVLDLSDLQPHLHSIPDLPAAIPYLTSYYRRSWGFCLTERQRTNLLPGAYRCVIDSEFRADGQLDVAQCMVAGESSREIFFSTYLCHPSLANNELSGPVVQTTLLRVLAGVRGLRLSYRGAFTTETLGTLCYLKKFGHEIKERIEGGAVVTSVGDPGPFTFVKSRRGGTMNDRIFEHVLEHLPADAEVRLRDWHPIGSDERQYCSPGFNFPIGSFSRSRFQDSPEYHTSLDNLDYVTEEGLQASLRVLLRVCQAAEMNLYPRRTNPFGEPQLGKRGLYRSDRTSVDQATLDRMFVLAYADGATCMLRIAQLAGRPIWGLLEALESLVAADLVTLSNDSSGSC